MQEISVSCQELLNVILHQFAIFLKRQNLSLMTPVTIKSKQKNLFKKSKGQKVSSEPIDWRNKHQSIIKSLRSPEFMVYQVFSLPFIVGSIVNEAIKTISNIFKKKFLQRKDKRILNNKSKHFFAHKNFIRGDFFLFFFCFFLRFLLFKFSS